MIFGHAVMQKYATPKALVGMRKYGSQVPNLASLVAHATREARFGTRDPYFHIPTPSALRISALPHGQKSLPHGQNHYHMGQLQKGALSGCTGITAKPPAVR